MQERSTLDLDRLAAEAAEWFVRLNDRSHSARNREQFAEWLLRSPQHLEAYLTIARIGGEIGLFENLPSKDELIADARADQDSQPKNVVELRPGLRRDDHVVTCRRRVRRRSRFNSAVAASLLVAVLGVGTLVRHFSQAQTHLETQVGEQRSVLLEEGSTVFLNTNTEASVALSRDERRVALNRGEARFTVSKDPQRPFIVTTPHAVVQALGTVFNVHIDATGTVVSVIEGHVKVMQREGVTESADDSDAASEEIAPGEQLGVTATGAVQSDPRQSFSRAALWPRHQISFHEETLADVVAEFNRYRKHPLRIADAELANHEVDGTFDAFDHDSLLDYLERYQGVRVEREASGTVVLRRKP
jgi:transmembrane sensor